MPAEPRAACTIILCHPRDDGFAVFMVQRHRKSGFLPSAWVFPGGRVDDADALHGHPRISGGEAASAQMGLSHADGVATLVAGVRETFEEAGVWLGQGKLPQMARDALNAHTADLVDVLEAHDASVDLDRLGVWSWWVTPEIEPRRYDTRFLVAVVDVANGRHDDHETVDSAWLRPSDVLADCSLSRFPMAPPTWWTLKELAAHADAAAVLDAAESRQQRPIVPIKPIIEYSEGFNLYLPGHEKHPDPRIDGMPVRVSVDEQMNWVAHEG